MKSRFVNFVGFVVIGLLMSGCNTEQKLAKKFVAERPHIAAAVYFPESAEVKTEYNIYCNNRCCISVYRFIWYSFRDYSFLS